MQGSVASWPAGLFTELHHHMRQWSREMPQERTL